MTASNGQFMSYLDSNQQDLLAAALSSNNPHQQSPPTSMSQQFGNGNGQNNFGQLSYDSTMDPSLFMNTNNLAMPAFDSNFNPMHDSPFLDYADNDANFDFDSFNGTDGQMIGSLPDEEGDDDDDEDDEPHKHEKRKSFEGEKDDNGHAGKRREGETKEPKKPGRKPLTSEPTNKRKAQNRAAQRAFRERKEKHLKDLETKVDELEKASEAANHENGLLRAQVDRLQIELREYRKRLSMNSGLIGRSPSLGGNMFMQNSGMDKANNAFQFDFPKFGNLPGGVFGHGINSVGNKSSAVKANVSPGVLARNGSGGQAISPGSQIRSGSTTSNGASPRTNGSSSSTPGQNGGSTDRLSSVFSPGTFDGMSGTTGFENWVTTTTTAEPESNATGQSNPSRIFQFNSNPASTASPASSTSFSQYGGNANSSCGTSPEPSHSSPKTRNLDTINECATITTSEGEVTFCDKLNEACGNIRNPIPRTKSQSDGTKQAGANGQTPPANNAAPRNEFSYFNTMASQNGGFNPELFDTYREPQNALFGDSTFTGGFFNDAMPGGDFGSPFDWANITAPTGLTPALTKSNPLEVADALQAGEEDEVVPADEPGAMLSCHKIWDKLQERPDFKDGSLDIDGLCSELRQKARCSESGVVIDQKDVDSALKRMSPAAEAKARAALAK